MAQIRKCHFGEGIFRSKNRHLTFQRFLGDQAGYSMVANGSGSITSSVANLTVLSPVRSGQPQPRTILTGTRRFSQLWLPGLLVDLNAEGELIFPAQLPPLTSSATPNRP